MSNQQQQKQDPSSAHPSDGWARATSTDRSDNAPRSQSKRPRLKPSPFKRFSALFKPKEKVDISKPSPAHNWKAFHPTNVGLHLTQDPNPETNANHRLLPEEHRAAAEEAIKMAAALQEQHLQPPREFHGPVPRNRVNSKSHPSLNIDRHVSEVRLLLDLAALSPLERDVLHKIRRTRRSSHFHPLMAPTEEVLLVHHDDTATIRSVQDMVRGLPEKEKQLLAQDLSRFLPAEKNYMLKLLLYHPAMRVTTNSRGQGLGMEAVEEPKQWRNLRSENMNKQSMESGSRHTGDVRFHDTAKINRTQTFEIKSERMSSLRGGSGESDDKVSVRSSSTYRSLLSDSHVPRLEDDQRPPSLMWYLAGGKKGKKPTGAELRERKKAEIENRKQVGFLGTLLGRRAPRPKRTEVEEYKPADAQQDPEPTQDEPGPEPPAEHPEPPPPNTDKSLPPTPDPAASINSQAETLKDADAKSQDGSLAAPETNSEQPPAEKAPE